MPQPPIVSHERRFATGYRWPRGRQSVPPRWARQGLADRLAKRDRKTANDPPGAETPTWKKVWAGFENLGRPVGAPTAQKGTLCHARIARAAGVSCFRGSRFGGGRTYPCARARRTPDHDGGASPKADRTSFRVHMDRRRSLIEISGVLEETDPGRDFRPR